jgi:hypothetical protein
MIISHLHILQDTRLTVIGSTLDESGVHLKVLG